MRKDIIVKYEKTNILSSLLMIFVLLFVFSLSVYKLFGFEVGLIFTICLSASVVASSAVGLENVVIEWYSFWHRANRKDLGTATEEDTHGMWNSVREEIGKKDKYIIPLKTGRCPILLQKGCCEL